MTAAPHLVNLTGTQPRRYMVADFTAPYAHSTDDGWTAAAIRHGTAVTALLIADLDQAGVVIVSESLRAPGLAAAFSRFPVRHLERAFAADAPQAHRDTAWAGLRRLHDLARTVPADADETARRAWLSWGNLPARDAIAWRAVGVTSGINAHYYVTNGLTPTQIGVYVGDGAYRPFRWHRADLALYARHALTVDEAVAWSHLANPLALTEAYLRYGYTVAQADALHRAIRRRDRTQTPKSAAQAGSALADWVRPDISPDLAPVAVAAGLTPDEAAADPDLDTLRALAALRRAAPA